jgi:hypothetical protein
MPPEMETTRKR